MNAVRQAAGVSRRAVLGGLVALAAGCDTGPRASRASIRAVSISPSTTEAVFAVGAGGLLVGRSRYCDFPPEAKALPAVGGFADPNIEAILGLRPSLVVGAHGPAGPGFEQALGARGIATYFPETESIAQIEAMIRGIGERFHASAGAAAAIETLRARRREVERRVQGKPRVRAVLLFDVTPISAAGPGGFPDELLRIAGAENVVKEGGAYPTLNMERLIALAPDVILDTTVAGMGGAPGRVAALRDAPGWKELRAIREGRVQEIASGAALRPGPRVGEGLEMIARALALGSAP